jgi:hypothetical protein
MQLNIAIREDGLYAFFPFFAAFENPDPSVGLELVAKYLFQLC